jgi:hypothetical protein
MPKPPSRSASDRTDPPDRRTLLDAGVLDVLVLNSGKPTLTLAIDEYSQAIVGRTIRLPGDPAASAV